MRNRIRLGFFVTIAAALCALMAPRASAQNVPQGSYLQTCASVQAGRNGLYANCQDTQGAWRYSVLPQYQECVSDIANIDGELRCERRGGVQWDRNRQGWLPPGSYAETCRDIRLDGNNMYAKCENMSHRWTRTSLQQFDGCVGGIINDNGQLVCGRRAAPYSGSYVRTCGPIYVRGDDLRARCQTANGMWTWTQLDGFDRCGGDIANENGQLRCEWRGREHDADYRNDRDRDHDRDGDHDRNAKHNSPRGSFQNTCRDVSVNGDHLKARCQTADGHWNWSEMNDWDRCRGDIANMNGQLTCSR
ncbi:MAG TPA: CVNH domain-containing protein [Candidatus Limnocylindrales bacterium]|nr:CVNH domain-containing protein [Candidatus Limnocylindrales bacterium]